TDLRLAHFGHGIAEIVIGGNGVNLDAFAVRQALQFLAARLRPVERVAVRPFAINLDAVVAELFRGANEFRQSERFAAIPAAQIRNAVESDFHLDEVCFSAAHTIALLKIVVNASFSKSHGPCPMKIYTLRAAIRSLVQMTG